MSKGSNPRPFDVNRFNESFDRIFNKGEKDMSIAEQFDFIDHHELTEWSETLHRDTRFDERRESALYTDGDSGVAIVTLSDEDVEDGLQIRLVDCAYIDVMLEDLHDIHCELLERLEQDIENDV